jgi:hypothetical protein
MRMHERISGALRFACATRYTASTLFVRVNRFITVAALARDALRRVTNRRTVSLLAGAHLRQRQGKDARRKIISLQRDTRHALFCAAVLPRSSEKFRGENRTRSRACHITARGSSFPLYFAPMMTADTCCTVQTGSLIAARKPPIGLRSRTRSPPWARAMSRAIARPNPTPPFCRLRP